jgi:predicted branched-subunit amino acid permease
MAPARRGYKTMSDAAAPAPVPRPLRAGLLAILPFLPVVAPFGVLFGVLATEAGMTLAQVMAFTTIVIAGVAQFAALGLLEEGAPFAVIVASAMAVNLRMVMYSAALVPHLGPAPLWQRAIVSYALFDQTFALAQGRYEAEDAAGARWSVADKVRFYFGATSLIVPCWLLATWAGATLGAFIPEAWPIDFALPLAFVAMVGPMLRTRAHMAAAAVSVVAALALAPLPWNLGLIAAAALGMAAGAEIERRTAR